MIHELRSNLPNYSRVEGQQPGKNSKSIIPKQLFEALPAGNQSPEEEYEGDYDSAPDNSLGSKSASNSVV